MPTKVWESLHQRTHSYKNRCALNVIINRVPTSILSSWWEGEGNSLKRLAGGVKSSHWEACGLSLSVISKETGRESPSGQEIQVRRNGLSFCTHSLPPSRHHERPPNRWSPNHQMVLPASSQPRRKDLSCHDRHMAGPTLFFLTIFFHFILRFWYQVFTCSWVSPRDWAKSNLEGRRHKSQ